MFRRIIALCTAVACSAVLASPKITRADGLIVISDPPPTTIVRGHFTFAPLEVTYHKVDTDIKDQVAVTSVDQEFYNPNSARLEGDYIFPVPENAQINKFTMDIDGKPVEAELLPADKARDIYNTIVRQTRDPALLEYAGRAMFRVHIFPIEPNSKKHITLKYTELLKQDNGLLDYHYTLNTEKFSSRPLQNVSIKVNLSGSDPITTLYSPTHTVDIVRHGETSATVGYEAKDVRPDTDFHLFIGHKAAPVGINLLSFRPDPDKPGYFVLLASPTLSKEVKAMPKDVVFVMDTSGSMSGDKIDQARKALKYCTDTLNPQDRFEIVRFSTEAEPLFNGLKDATDENRKKAADFAMNLAAAGGTAIDEALAKALGDRSNNADRMFLVVFITDGQPTIGESNPDVILAHVKTAAKGAPVRIFSFGLGTDVNTKLLDLVAEQTRGYSQYVLPRENLELAMSSFWGKVQDPVIANLKLDSGDVRLGKVYPGELPDLFKGDQLVVFGTYEKPGKTAVTISGMVNGTQQKFAQDVTFEEKTDASKDWIAKLWATRRIGFLLDEIRLHGENKEVKDEIVDLARRFGVVTPYTAMLIIEDEQRRNIPVADRSMRELEFDQTAAGNAAFAVNSIHSVNGAQAVANSGNMNGYKFTNNLAEAGALGVQSESRLQYNGGTDGADLAKGQGAPSTVATGSTIVNGSGSFGGGGAGGGGGRRGGGGGGNGDSGLVISGVVTVPSPTTQPQITRDQLNLGNQTANGWQTAPDKAIAKDMGYRTINNYAQQSRVVNNRSFFLNGNQWTDAQVQQLPTAKPVKIVFNSKEYFDLLTKYPEAAQYFSLGSNLTVVLGGTVYDIVEEVPATGAPK